VSGRRRCDALTSFHDSRAYRPQADRTPRPPRSARRCAGKAGEQVLRALRPLTTVRRFLPLRGARETGCPLMKCCAAASSHQRMTASGRKQRAAQLSQYPPPLNPGQLVRGEHQLDRRQYAVVGTPTPRREDLRRQTSIGGPRSDAWNSLCCLTKTPNPSFPRRKFPAGNLAEGRRFRRKPRASWET
jgi:hypothetical protein